MNSPSLQKNWYTFFAFLIPLVFYWYTCLPSLGLGDSAMLVEEINTRKFSTHVNTHNLTLLLGILTKWWPWGDMAYHANLVSVLAGGLCISILYISLNLIHRCRRTALVCSLALMVSHSMWWTTSCKQEHAVDAFLTSVAIYLYCHLQRFNKITTFYLLFVLAGFGFFNHFELGCILGGASIALLWKFAAKKEKMWPLLWRCALCFFIGLIPYLLVFMHDVSQTHSISQTISGAVGGQFKRLFFKGGIWNGITNYLYLIFFQFPSPYLLTVALGPYFFLRSWKLNEYSIGVIFTYIPVIAFFMFLNVWDKFLFMLPSFVILCFWSSFTVHRIFHHPRVENSKLLPSLILAAAALCLGWNIFFYAHLSQWGSNIKSVWYQSFNNTYYANLYRSNVFQANPNKRNYHDIEDLCTLILNKLPAKAELWDDDSRLYYQLTTYYQQQYHLRPDLDIEMINSWGFEGWGSDKSTFIKRLNYAYKNGKDFFMTTQAHPYQEFLNANPNKSNIVFKEYRLNDTWWIYKLVTEKEKYSLEKTSWGRWDILPSNKPFLVDLKLDNVLSFNEGDVLLQDDQANWGPYWKNDDQIFFSPSKINGEIGFLLRFNKAFKARISLNITTSFDFGIIEIFLNGKPLSKEPIDLYSPNVYFTKVQFTDVPLDAGNNILTIRVIGKNEHSSGMKMGIDTIGITPNPS